MTKQNNAFRVDLGYGTFLEGMREVNTKPQCLITTAINIIENASHNQVTKSYMMFIFGVRVLYTGGNDTWVASILIGENVVTEPITDRAELKRKLEEFKKGKKL